MNENRIDGEFHYAVFDEEIHAVTIHRISDDKIVGGWSPSAGDPWDGDNKWLLKEGELKLKTADEQARFFIEQKTKEIDELVKIVASHGPYFPNLGVEYTNKHCTVYTENFQDVKYKFTGKTFTESLKGLLALISRL